jgi:hypothetical protein
LREAVLSLNLGAVFFVDYLTGFSYIAPSNYSIFAQVLHLYKDATTMLGKLRTIRRIRRIFGYAECVA